MSKADRTKRAADRMIWRNPAPEATSAPVRKFRLRWSGQPPLLGEFLMCDSPRARKAYRLIERPADGLSEREYRVCMCEVMPVAALPADAVIHYFVRERRRPK